MLHLGNGRILAVFYTKEMNSSLLAMLIFHESWKILTDSFLLLDFFGTDFPSRGRSLLPIMLNWYTPGFVSLSSSWREAFSHSIPPLRFVARTICPSPAPEHRSPVFPSPGRSDESRWWEVDLEHASSRELAGHHLELRSRSEVDHLICWDTESRSFQGPAVDENCLRKTKKN